MFLYRHHVLYSTAFCLVFGQENRMISLISLKYGPSRQMKNEIGFCGRLVFNLLDQGLKTVVK